MKPKTCDKVRDKWKISDRLYYNYLHLALASWHITEQQITQEQLSVSQLKSKAKIDF